MKMVKEKNNAKTDTQQTTDHDIKLTGLWPVELTRACLGKGLPHNQTF